MGEWAVFLINGTRKPGHHLKKKHFKHKNYLEMDYKPKYKITKLLKEIVENRQAKIS